MHENLETVLFYLSRELHGLNEQKKIEFEWTKSHHGFATKADLDNIERNIMEAIQNYAARVETAINAIGSDIDSVVTSFEGVAKDVANLKEVIAKIQNSPGTLSPEDQASLDKGEFLLNSLAVRVSGVKDALAALDAATETPSTPNP